MPTVWAVPAALGASVCYAAGLVLQHREAARSSAEGQVRVAGLVGLLARPVWLLGISFDTAGLALHVLALGLGPVSLVQPLQVTSLLFALLLGAAINRRPLKSAELEAGLLVVAGVTAFLVLTRPGVTTAALPRATAGLLAAVAGATMAAVTVAVRRARPEWRAAALGAVSGIGFAVTAVLLGSLASVRAHRGWHALLTSAHLPALVVVVVVGGAALVLSQTAFQVGSLTAALPSLTVVDPVLAVVLGAALLGERLHLTAVSVAVSIGSLVAVTLGTVRLAQSQQAGLPPMAGTVAGGPRPGGLPRWLAAGCAGIGVGAVLSVLPLLVARRVDSDAGRRSHVVIVAVTVALGALTTAVTDTWRSRHGDRDR